MADSQIVVGGRGSRNALASEMRKLGLHYMKPEWANAGIGNGRVFSSTFRSVTLKVFGSDEEMSMPVQTCTTVGDVKQMLAKSLAIKDDVLVFVHRQGSIWRVQQDFEQVAAKAVVRGIKSFKQLPHTWPHPLAILGAGYNGLKTGLVWSKSTSNSVVLFDRNDQLGGYWWLCAAKRHSRLQTDFPSYDLLFGPEFTDDDCVGNVDLERPLWPDRQEVLEHFRHVAETSGLLSNCRLGAEVRKLEVEATGGSRTRQYELTVRPTDESGDFTFLCSGLISCPGTKCKVQRVVFLGEDVFRGHVCYGAQDELPYESLQSSVTVIVGCGAFAIESLRTCLEYSASKLYLVVRKHNLVCPRLSCWFVHRAATPVLSDELLRSMEPMYRLAGLGTPFDFPAVSHSGDLVTIQQGRRFAISDLLFLALAHRRVELIQDEVKRLTSRDVHLQRGSKLSNVRNLIKALGLVGDAEVDKLHSLRTLIGLWPEGDFQRPIHVEAEDVHAESFEALASGLPSHGMALTLKFLLEHPGECFRLLDMSVLEILPRHKSDEMRPAYAANARHIAATLAALGALCPKVPLLTSGVAKYKKELMAKACPLEAFLQECRREWQEFQESWRLQGHIGSELPYPYNAQDAIDWEREHLAAVGPQGAVALSGAALEDPAYLEESFSFWQEQARDQAPGWRSLTARGPTGSAKKPAAKSLASG